MKRLTFLAALSWAWLAAAIVRAQELELMQIAPTGAVAVIQYNGGEKLAPAFEKSALGQIYLDSQMQAFLKKPAERFYREFEKQTNPSDPAVLHTFVRQLKAKPSMIAVYGGDEVSALWCVRLGKDAHELGKILDELSNGDAALRERKVGGHSVKVSSNKTAFVVATNTFLFATNAKLIEQALGRIDKPVLTAAPTSKASHPPAGDPIGQARVELATLLRLIRSEMKDKDGPAKFDAVMAAVGFDSVDGVELDASFDGLAIRADARLVTSKPLSGLLKSGAQAKPLDDKPFQLVPKNVASATISRCNLADAWDTVMAAIQAASSKEDFGRTQQKIADAEKEVNVKFRDELVSGLGDTFVFYSKPGAAPMMPGEFVLIVSLKPNNTVASCVDRLSQHAIRQMATQQPAPPFSIKDSDINGQHTYALAGMPMIMPCWTVRSNYLYAAINPQALRAAIAQVEESEPSLLDNDDFRNSRKMLPAAAVSVSYEDTRQALAGVYGMIAAFGPMLAAKPDAPVDMMQLPAIATIQSKLFGGVSVTTVEGSEFVMRSYSPFGTQVGIGAGGAMMAGMMLPALNTAREKARRVSCLSNLKQIGLACHVYADKHDGKFPPYLDVLFPDYLPDKKVLICPSASHEGKSGSSDYVYAAGGTTKAKDQILAYDNTGNHRGVGRNVLFTDGHVEWMMESTFQQRLRQNK